MDEKMKASSKDAQQTFISAIGAIFIAIACIAIGYAIVSGVPFVTEKVAYATIDDADSPFKKDELVDVALAVRDYSFGAHDEQELLDTVVGINDEAATPYDDLSAAEIADAPDEYAITREQISHLDDVNDVANRVFLPIIGIASITAFILFAGFRMFGPRPVANMLLFGGCGAAVVLILVALWALLSFDTFFAALHSLMFEEGSWTFPADSLLITSLPEGFWAGMGATWLAISLIFAVICVVLGAVLRRRTCK